MVFYKFRLFPFLDWFKNYSSSVFRADLVSGFTVALILIPQSMAYAQLAGLPTYFGLYAGFLPPMVAALLGSSRQLATGPVAIVSLMTATALEPLATAGSESYIAYAILLALLVGVFQFLLGFLKLGMIVNFISHPVINGFINAVALIIASSQLPNLLGVTVEKADRHYITVYRVFLAAGEYIHWPTLALGILAFGIMLGLKAINRRLPYVLFAAVITTLMSWWIGFEEDQVVKLRSLNSEMVQGTILEYNDTLDTIYQNTIDRVDLIRQKNIALKANGLLSAEVRKLYHQIDLVNLAIQEGKEKAGLLRTMLRSFQFYRANGKVPLQFYLKDEVPDSLKGERRVWRLKVDNQPFEQSAIPMIGGGAVVGAVPRGLPNFILPKISFQGVASLLSMAMIISLLGFMEAISIAKAMAAKTGQRLDYNQELIGQGFANIIGSFGQSYPVSGSFSRSAVNLQAGAVTGMSNVISSGVIVITLLFFTPLLYHLPQSVLAAIIMMAVIGLVHVKGFIHAWQAQKYDGFIFTVSFVSTLVFAPHLDKGIMISVVLSLGLYLLRNMKPDIAILSKHPDTTFRNSARFNLEQCRYISVVRFHGSLFFANVNYLEEVILERIATMPDLKHILIVGDGINELDASGEEMLSNLLNQLREAGYELSLSGLNDSVLDVIRRTGLYEQIGEDHLFRNTKQAIEVIHAKAHQDSEEEECPLIHVRYKEE